MSNKNTEEQLNIKLNNVSNIETIKLEDLTIYLHNNNNLSTNNYFMSVLSLNIFNHPLNTRCIETARLRCIKQLERLLKININKYHDNLVIINNMLKKTN
jgi:hypothetical protein